MKTAVMEEIMRQRDQDLKAAVESTLSGDVKSAFEKLGSNVAEVKPDNLAGAAAAQASPVGFVNQLAHKYGEHAEIDREDSARGIGGRLGVSCLRPQSTGEHRAGKFPPRWGWTGPAHLRLKKPEIISEKFDKIR